MAWSRKDWWILLALTGIAIFFRFFQLGTLPPGFQFDEAFNAIDAQLVLAGDRPLFLPANAGREVLYTYWQALLIRFFGFDVYTLRLASAILGVLAIPATYLLVRGLLRHNSRIIATGTALVLAISIWHIHFSRYGIRVISMPLIFSGAFGIFWLGAFAARRRTRLLAYIGSGLLTGLSVWTHPTGRLAPFVLLGFTLWLLWRYPARRRWGWDTPLGGLVITGMTAFLVFLPLGIEFYRHPEFFFSHASEVSVFAARVSGDSPVAALLDNFLHVLGMFSFAGDLGWTHGLAGRPVFDWPLALLFYLGVGLAVVRLWPRRPATTENDPDQAALALFAIWAAVMLFPSILSEAAPNYSRTLPALPALFVPAGLGIAWLVNQRRPQPWVGPVVASLILLYSAGQMSYDYFVRFAHSPDVYYMYDGDKLDALDYLSQYTGKNQVYLSQLWGDMHSTVYLLRQDLGIKSVDTADTVVLPPPGQGALYAFPHEQLERAEQLAGLWPGLTVESVPDPYGHILLHTVHIDAGTAASWPPGYQPTTEGHATFTDAPALVGMQAASPDKQISLFWEADRPISGSLTTFVHLIDRDGQRVAQVDKLPGNGSYPTYVWTTGERVIDRAYPALLDRCAGGESVRVQVGWYELREGNPQRPRADSAGSTALAGEMTLPYLAYPLETWQPDTSISSPISPTLALEGYSLRDQDLQAGSPLTLDLLWHSTDADKDASGMAAVRLSLVSATQRHELWQGPIAPGSDWKSGLALCRRIHTTLPQDLGTGDYTLAVDSPLLNAAEPITLGSVAIGPSTRLYELPELARTLHITFTGEDDSEIALVGLSAEPHLDAETNQLGVDLVWQPSTRINANYNAFVHLLDSTGAIVAQSDATPGGDKISSRWLPGEVILDQHILTLPPEVASSNELASYQLVAGLYDPIGMQRLLARTLNGADLPDGRAPLGALSLPSP
ncbi:MAG: glycosyltransferase family 39 protein [Caldilineaceae bacterium]|nr:glycosyltransferase family 39 protein [Caldilineaceae bacterium]